MKKSQRLQRIVRLSTTTEQRAALALAQAQRELAQLQTQAHDLRTYQAEYMKRLGAAVAPTLNGYTARKLLLFVRRIEDTINVLMHKIDAVDRRCTAEREQWIAQHRKVMALTEVASRARATEEVVLNMRAQREIDERGRRCEEIEAH